MAIGTFADMSALGHVTFVGRSRQMAQIRATVGKYEVCWRGCARGIDAHPLRGERRKRKQERRQSDQTIIRGQKKKSCVTNPVTNA